MFHHLSVSWCSHRAHSRAFTPSAVVALLMLPLLLTGCLEQYQTTRSPAGSLTNFLLHLQSGELDDAAAYFAPGLVERTAELDASIKAASARVQKYEIDRGMPETSELGDSELNVLINGRVRRLAPVGSPTPAPDAGWTDTAIISARMV